MRMDSPLTSGEPLMLCYVWRLSLLSMGLSFWLDDMDLSLFVGFVVKHPFHHSLAVVFQGDNGEAR